MRRTPLRIHALTDMREVSPVFDRRLSTCCLVIMITIVIHVLSCDDDQRLLCTCWPVIMISQSLRQFIRKVVSVGSWLYVRWLVKGKARGGFQLFSSLSEMCP